MCLEKKRTTRNPCEMQTPNRIEIFFLCKWDSKCFRFFVEMLFCLFVCFIAFSIVSVGKRKVAVMTFYFLFCLECYFRNKLKHPSVGAGINFKSKYFAISRNSNVNLIQSFFPTVHKEFKFQELYTSIQSHFIIQWHWNSMDIYNEHWFQFYTKYECQWLFKALAVDTKNEHQRHENKKRNLHTKDDISPCCALHWNRKKYLEV